MCPLCFSPTMFEFSQTHDKVSKPANASLNQMESPTSSSKKRTYHLCHETAQPNSFSPLLCPSSLVQLPMQWWMQKWKECNTAHDGLYGEGKSLHKIPSWELILYHSLLLLSRECCYDSFSTLWNLLVFVTCSEPDINWLLNPTIIFFNWIIIIF